MLYAGKLMLTVVGGGALLGSLLGSFANPVMKEGPDAPWGERLGARIHAAASTGYIEPLPEDLTPPTVPDSYAPAFALTELPELWQPDFAALPVEEYETRSYASWSTWRSDPDPMPSDEPIAEAASSARVELVPVAEAGVAAEAAAEDAVQARPPNADTAGEAPLGPLY
jgi:hypothetical protein